MKVKLLRLTIWACVGGIATALLLAYVIIAQSGAVDFSSVFPPLFNGVATPPPPATHPTGPSAPSPVPPPPPPTQVKWVPPGFKGPTGQPHVNGPSGGPPNY